MSDLAATNCGCGCGDGGNNNCLLLILILLCCGGCGNGSGCGCGGNDCSSISGLSCFLAAVAVVVHSLVMETAVVAAAS